MNCPLCEHELTPLKAFLAGTETGTQCPACGTRLRSLKLPPLAFEKRSEAEGSTETRRRAA
jgi:hypothetical protein